MIYILSVVPGVYGCSIRWLLLLGSFGHAHYLFLQHVFLRLGCVTSTTSPVVETSAPVAASGMIAFA